MTRSIRINLFTVTVLLICIGIVMIYSASSIYASERYKDGFSF
jgi:cell division protein FtsW (lipid II flippase)